MSKTDNQSSISSRMQDSNNIIDIHYQQTGEASPTNKTGMQEMQATCQFASLVKICVIDGK